MARPGGAETRAKIREAVREIVAENRIDGFTLDAVAERVGVTRQAVLYHFKSRDRLLADSVLEILKQESDSLSAAAEEARPGVEGAGDFLAQALSWHLEDINRFRMQYALPQVSPVFPSLDEQTLRERVYPVTGKLYSALEKQLAAGELPDGVDPRRLGIALHMFVLGVACYEGALQRSNAPFAHDWKDIGEALARAISR